MIVSRILVSGLVAVAITTRASAQQLPAVVQLPSFQTFSYSGTVVVPDSGAAYLGGNNTSASGWSRRGLSRGFGSALGSSQASISATIIDHGEIDRQLLGGTPQEFLKSDRGKSDPRAAGVDPAEEGKALVRYAREQYREGNEAAAFDTYRMAIGVLQGRLRELATIEFRRVFGAAADQSLSVASRLR